MDLWVNVGRYLTNDAFRAIIRESDDMIEARRVTHFFFPVDALFRSLRLRAGLLLIVLFALSHGKEGRIIAVDQSLAVVGDGLAMQISRCRRGRAR